MDILELVRKDLKKRDYDGLFCVHEPCGCQLSDLMPCGLYENLENCEPGYKVKCTPETCGIDGDCDFHISKSKKNRIK
jgi:hypothetical protein